MAGGQSAARPAGLAAYQREALAGHNHRNIMDRIYIAIIATAMLLLLGAAGLLVTRTEILM
jgi:hypothetical protein